ncbi:hypothetical protein ACFQ1E_08865 [Sphingomonas canadensis]|uniref:Uncharacterized protein n=1 Tax=Sphingomonas canadensis TaxID=1219257 RepID=A0ABW3H4P3_9SPHN|nr:hypothetical protein [Sphingomonas canadensis]MCW3836150.1 hypothetical protein [Sphingomonas canadensis]
MTRPQSIDQFETIFFFHLATTVAILLLSIGERTPLAIALPGGLVLVNLLLWYCITRYASNIARWIYTVLFGFAAAGAGMVLAEGGAILDFTALSTTGLTALNGLAVWLLFRPDAAAWFAGETA